MHCDDNVHYCSIANVKVLTVMSAVTLLCVLVGMSTGHPYSSMRKAGLYTQDIGSIAM